ncbi:MAG: hypothetical protein NUV82_00465 [Candidatus Komeilibacteria bacterium]|nr:hypothetical protein [Candidatus Komeilibacteria bacterium]
MAKLNFHSLWVYVLHGLALVFNLLIWIWLFFYLKPSSETWPLHYNIYFGIDQLGPATRLYWIAWWGFITVLMNFFLSSLYARTDYRLPIYLGIISLLAQVILGISLVLLFINHI